MLAGVDWPAVYEMPDRQARRLARRFMAWVAKGVLESFRSPEIQASFRALGPPNRDFIILAADHFDGLPDMDVWQVTTVWRQGLTPRRLVRRQRKVRENAPVRTAVRRYFQDGSDAENA